MNAKDTIIDWINGIFTVFDGINLIYAYDKMLETHLVEVTPAEIEESEDFAKKALEFEHKFFLLFPEEDLLISEPRPFKNMENIIYTITSPNFQSLPTALNQKNDETESYNIHIINENYSENYKFYLAA